MTQYYVWNQRRLKWLDGTEHSWTSSLYDAAIFTSAELASDIALRESSTADGVVVIFQRVSQMGQP